MPTDTSAGEKPRSNEAWKQIHAIPKWAWYEIAIALGGEEIAIEAAQKLVKSEYARRKALREA